MLSICISTDNSIDADWRGIGKRLRGAMIESSVEARRWNTPPEDCDAVIFVGANPMERGSIEHSLAARRHV
jgi:hypothetical protein